MQRPPLSLSWLSITVGLLASQTALTAALLWSPGGSAGGDGAWDATTANWWDGNAQVVYADNQDVTFASPAGVVEVNGAFVAGTLTIEDAKYRLNLDNDAGSRIQVQTLAGAGSVGFRGTINVGADNYPALESLRLTGLELQPQGTQRLETDLISLAGGSPVVAVKGGAGKVEYAGMWSSDTGSIFSFLRLEEGGHFVITGDADMRFIKEGFYTLQLWVTGDGTGTLELAEDFTADRTEGGTQRLGIGSMRIGAGTFISHRSANLPLGYRPRPDGSAQTNGHLAFENTSGSRWIVRGEDQVYPGAVWIYRSMDVVTEADLMHVGVTEFGDGYTAHNGWSVYNPVTVNKYGAGTLVLAGEQSYAPGASLVVREGTLVLRSDPAAGTGSSGGVTGAQLALQVETGARLEWSTSGAIKSLLVKGELLLDGTLAVENQGTLRTGAASRTEVILSGDSAAPMLTGSGNTILAGTLVVSRSPEYTPAAGTQWTVCRAVSLSANLTLEDRTGLGLALLQQGGDLVLVAENSAPDLPGAVWLEDSFDAPAAQWKDLSTVPLWGSPLAHSSAFEWADGVARLVRSGARSTSGYLSYNSPSSLKTFTCLDYQFPQAVTHAGSEVTLDFRLRWPQPGSTSGENGRVILAFNHAYPEGGLDLTPEGTPGSRYNDFTADWWARPAYHVRLRNSTTGAGGSFLQYGGGPEELGEYERASWWLPGFISGAGGVSPGVGDEFPANSWVRTIGGMARSTFTTFRYRILPDRQELWRDDNDDGVLTDTELKAVMPLPLESDAPLYNYFEQLEGLRVYWNGNDEGAASGQMELDWLRLLVQPDVSPVADAGAHVYAEVLVDGLAPVTLDAGGTADPEGASLLYLWFIDGEPAAASRLPVTRLLLPEGEHAAQLLVVDPAGNHSFAATQVTVTLGKARPVANAGGDQSVAAGNEWFGVATVSGALSFSPNGSIVRYRWTTGDPARVLADGPNPAATLALPIGSQTLTLTVWDNNGASAEASVRVIVDPPGSGDPPVVIYRENFSRPDTNTAGELGADYVGWKLTQPTGEPVKPIKYNGNAHRCLSWASWGNAPYVTRVNANPAGTEYDALNSGGHLWMNQMPYLNATPAEWLLWTDEHVLDRSAWDLDEITFYAMDGSPERVEYAPSVRIAGQWYIGWDWRIETQGNVWRYYVVPLGVTNWRLFEPSETFSVRNAAPVERLPDGNVEAFGFYMLKEYGWYENEVDNFTVYAQPHKAYNPYGDWVAQAVPQEVLLAPGIVSRLEPQADLDGDGWCNLLEYATGMDPMSAAPGIGTPRIFIDGGSLVLDLPINPEATNVVISCLSSSDLQQWQPVAPAAQFYTDPESGTSRQRWLLPLEAGLPDNRFFRWQAAIAQ